MRIIAIGDVHGRDFWKKVVEKEKDADMFVFVGDYFDNFPPIKQETILENFCEILKFKRLSPEKVTLLIGNHDFHYMECSGESYSGYSEETAPIAKLLLQDALLNKEIQIAYRYRDILFTHAGVSKTWLTDWSIKLNNKKYEIDEILNTAFLAQPEIFKFSQVDESLYGNDVSQSPIWIRPDVLKTDMIYGYIQVVGHSQVKQIINVEGCNLILIDTPNSGEYLIFDEGVLDIGKV